MFTSCHDLAFPAPDPPKGVEKRSFPGFRGRVLDPRIRFRTPVSRTRHILILFWTPLEGPKAECGIWPYDFQTALHGGSPKRGYPTLEAWKVISEVLMCCAVVPGMAHFS